MTLTSPLAAYVSDHQQRLFASSVCSLISDVGKYRQVCQDFLGFPCFFTVSFVKLLGPLISTVLFYRKIRTMLQAPSSEASILKNLNQRFFSVPTEQCQKERKDVEREWKEEPA
jgi:hypothetical protein